MPLMGGLAAGAIAAPIIGGIAGNLMSAGDRDKQLQLQQQALANVQGVALPDLASMQVALDKYQSQGQLTPEMEATIGLGPSAMGSVSTDPRLAQAQMQALARLQSIGGGGLRPEDLVAAQKIQNNVAQAEKGRQDAILQNMQARGVGGAGAELAARLASSQASANRASDQGMDIAGQASQRALQALSQAGQLGGSIRSQDFGEQSAKANAADVISAYNARNAQAVAGQNTGVKNAAQAQNLTAAQAVANANTGISNQNKLYNSGLNQQQYNNALQKASGVASGMNNLAGAYGNQAAQQAAMYAGIGNAAGKGAAAGYGMMNKTPQAKPAQGNLSDNTDNYGNNIA